MIKGVFQIAANELQMGTSIYILNHFTAGVILFGDREHVARHCLSKYVNAVNHTVYLVDPANCSTEEAESKLAATKIREYLKMRRSRGKTEWMDKKWTGGVLTHPTQRDGNNCGVVVIMKLKLCKPVVRKFKKWTSEALEDLRACLDCTDWDVFRTATNSLDEYTETVTSYISFCEDSCIPSSSRVSYNNDKPWFTAELRKLRLQKDQAFRSGNKDLYTESKYRFSKAVRDPKRLYSEKLQHQLSANDSASVWRGLRQITNYKPKSTHSMNNVLLADDLNEFYCRF
ncbi:uncharacterized protein LOC117748879 [Cyclopterus lumpus]|uniref:uncharacterized protein LOC117748879 n=1 Tax=Cyclopterus lumpus TaxID=8103 RepID=UPI0014860A28|nr:uncharacterized protein LOC117748879 [Cyclopterus lumpus]